MLDRYKFDTQTPKPPTNVLQQDVMSPVTNPNLVVPGQQKMTDSLLAEASVHEQKQVSMVCGYGKGSLQ